MQRHKRSDVPNTPLHTDSRRLSERSAQRGESSAVGIQKRFLVTFWRSKKLLRCREQPRHREESKEQKQKNQKGNLGIPPPPPIMAFIPPMRFIIFINPPPFIFFIIVCICSNSFSKRFTS